MTFTQISYGIDADTPVKASVTGGDYVHVWFGEGLAVHGYRQDIVAVFHRAIAALAPVEEQLCAERLVRDNLGLDLEPSS